MRQHSDLPMTNDADLYDNDDEDNVRVQQNGVTEGSNVRQRLIATVFNSIDNLILKKKHVHPAPVHLAPPPPTVSSMMVI